jgi:hypothetical protein
VIGLYAVALEPPAEALGPDGEALRVVRRDGFSLLVGAAPPAVSAEALRAYDAAVRRIADACAACLPARFGAAAASDEELCAQVDERAAELREALELVRGREQMTLRVHGDAPGPTQLGPLPAGPGARYLEERRRARRLPELDELRAALQDLVRAERVERHQERGLLASVYHLIDRGSASPYLARLNAVEGLRVIASGPWPAWSFAPEVLSP